MQNFTAAPGLTVNLLDVQRSWLPEPKLYQGGRALTRALADAMDPLIRYHVGVSAFPTEEAMNKLIEDTKADMENPNYHFYVDM